MDVRHVPGKNVGDLFLYTLSTCGWCRKTKKWLDGEGIEYRYVDVDLAAEGEKDRIMDEVRRWNPACSFPTIVVNKSKCVVGYNPERIMEALR